MSTEGSGLAMSSMRPAVNDLPSGTDICAVVVPGANPVLACMNHTGGPALGEALGLTDGLLDGLTDGLAEMLGLRDGDLDGLALGDGDGLTDGETDALTPVPPRAISVYQTLMLPSYTSPR